MTNGAVNSSYLRTSDASVENMYAMGCLCSAVWTVRSLLTWLSRSRLPMMWTAFTFMLIQKKKENASFLFYLCGPFFCSWEEMFLVVFPSVCVTEDLTCKYLIIGWRYFINTNKATQPIFKENIFFCTTIVFIGFLASINFLIHLFT